MRFIIACPLGRETGCMTRVVHFPRRRQVTSRIRRSRHIPLTHAHCSTYRAYVLREKVLAPLSPEFFFSLAVMPSAGIQSRPAKLPEFIPDKKRRNRRKRERARRGWKVEWFAPLIHAGARVIPRPRHILTSFRLHYVSAKWSAHTWQAARRGGWFISNTQSHSPYRISAPRSPPSHSPPSPRANGGVAERVGETTAERGGVRERERASNERGS